ncbi:hypothetical protein LTR62_006251 [Meristemomyces frigidus]|uniref:Pre-rrna processing protein n=1 Tax=Meristemomyces frigidus TaxID=1508187 RepID=A0AAN7YEP8_9PEZI|nr:hypothetical protein LTR62_006251 [Meristemomyces frigidus]
MANDDRQPRRDEDGDTEAATEQTPLLPSSDNNTVQDVQQEGSATGSPLDSLGASKPRTKRRWPSLIALAGLCILVILIIVFAFLAPSTVEEYAQQAVVFEPTSLSIDGFTSTGVRARIQGDFMMDASRVQRKPVRDLGRFFTYIAHEAESGESDVEVSLPEYGNVILGTARVPGVKVDLRNGHTTHMDVLADLQPGDVEGIRRIANDWIEGRLGQLRVLGKAKVPVKSGLVNLGKQAVQQEFLLANKDIPSIPSYDIKKLNFREVEIPKGGRGMAADVGIAVQNDYPVEFTVPPLAFDVLVGNCQKSDPYIKLANAETHDLHIQPKHNVEVNATGVVHELPDILTQDCPGMSKSPLDMLLGNYLHGKDNTIYVRGSNAPQLHTPRWITDLISDITVPVPVPGKSFGHLIKKFSLTDTHFSLPDPFGDPNDPSSNPRISANVNALIALPKEMNFNISVSQVRADADIFYHGKKLGKLDLHKWQHANSTRLDTDNDSEPMLMVESAVKNAPIHITDDDVFTQVVQDLLFGRKEVIMHIKADVDVKVVSALGELAVRKIPAEGEVPVKPFDGDDGHKSPGDIAAGFRPKVFDLNIISTTSTGLALSALVNVTNPTVYSATVPYVDIHIVKNGSVLGHATAKNIEVKPGNNTNLKIEAVYDPMHMGGKSAVLIGRELLSQYISGYNTTLVLQLHERSLPSLPSLGRALSNFSLELPTPQLHTPKPHPREPKNPFQPDLPANDGDGKASDDDDDDDKPHFIHDATFHLLTSTATFLLTSPLKHQTIYINSLNATAYYKGSSVGEIHYDDPFAIPPMKEGGEGTTSPRLPVDWSLGSVGYEAVKRALGGRLKLGAYAEVRIQIGRWREEVWYRGGGIGASVRI